jgi:hypothetical protein
LAAADRILVRIRMRIRLGLERPRDVVRKDEGHGQILRIDVLKPLQPWRKVEDERTAAMLDTAHAPQARGRR